ncbi:hypothetical protein HID58_085475 [Brassica napus]|uniref:Uncharacterized protein n=1 Tax=Brassica napus TaxID=3708 RepID=A0ABQ7XMP9_BRANA|nr:hypothetical protein HID58_085475 [Brassica napus]
MSTQRCQGYKCSFQWSFHWYLQSVELMDGGSDYLGKGVSKAVGDEQNKHWLVATSRQLEGEKVQKKVEVQKLMEENVNNAKSWL